MSPQISKQFRGLEDLVEIQDRADRINFMGTDISPVLRADPPSFDLSAPILEDKTVTGVATEVDMSTVPDGFYREILRASLNHDDPVDLNFVEVLMIRTVDSFFVAARTTIGTLANETTISIFGPDHFLIPPGWRLRVVFLGLAAGKIARVKTLHIDRPLGLGALR